MITLCGLKKFPYTFWIPIVPREAFFQLLSVPRYGYGHLDRGFPALPVPLLLLCVRSLLQSPPPKHDLCTEEDQRRKVDRCRNRFSCRHARTLRVEGYSTQGRGSFHPQLAGERPSHRLQPNAPSTGVEGCSGSKTPHEACPSRGGQALRDSAGGLDSRPTIELTLLHGCPGHILATQGRSTLPPTAHQ